MPVRGFDTVVLLFGCAAIAFFSKLAPIRRRALRGEGACHVGGKAMIRDQQIIRCAALILGEGRPPFVCTAYARARRSRSARLPSVTGSASSQNSDCAMTPSNADALPGP